MTLERLDRWARGWRGPWLAAAVVLISALPGVLAMPPLDRDESRFAQASAQMLETHDFVSIKFQDEPRDKKPVGIYWLQAASVAAVSSPEARAIWAYRLPSLLFAMLAAGACAWGAAGFFGAGRGLIAGALLGATFILSTEAGIAKTDATLCGLVVLMMAAFARIYSQYRDGAPSGRPARLVFWLAFALSALVKGPVGPLVAILAGAMLWIWDRKAPWLKGMGWAWGVVILLAVLGPWAWAITVATDGAFWGAAIGGDLAPKLAGGHESHGAPPGLHFLLSSVLMFPGSLLLPPAAVYAWRHRAETGVRFAIAWLVPTWIMFELLPTKLVHYTLPAYGALAWLAAAALAEPIGRRTRWVSLLFVVFPVAVLVGLVVYLTVLYGKGDEAVAALAALLILASGAAAFFAVLKGPTPPRLAAVLGLGVAAHMVLTGLLAPSLRPLWLSQRLANALAAARLDPRNGVTPGPVAVAGYAEPSLIFALGTKTELGEGSDAADAISEGRPAIVEERKVKDFQAELARDGAAARPAAVVQGLDYSGGDKDRLTIWAPVTAPGAAEGAGP